MKKNKKFQLKLAPTAIFLLIIGLYLAFFSNIFQITELKSYQNNQAIQSQEIERFKPFLLNQNYFLLDEDKVQKQIRKFNTQNIDIKVIKKFPNTVEIHFKEQTVVANIKSNDQKFDLLANGQIQSQNIPHSKLITLNFTKQKVLQEDSQILNPEQIQYIKDAYYYFRSEFKETLKTINILTIAKEMHLVTKNGTQIWIDMTYDYQKQINKLKNAQPSLDFKKKQYQYIDLRIQSFQDTKQKVIYKE